MNRTTNNRHTSVNVTTLDRKSSNILPAGKYFIGDLSYFLHSALCCKTGHYAVPDGRGFIAIKTYDGLWLASDDTTYSLESGRFGICSYELGDKRLWTGDGTFHTFIEPVSMTVDDDDTISFVSGTWSLTLNHDASWDSDYDEGYDSWS